MNEVRNILLGLEITRDGSQLSYYDRKLEEPVQVPAKIGSNRAIFPTMLAGSGQDELWTVGLEAEKNAGKSGWIVFEDLFDRISHEETWPVKGKKMSSAEILALYLRGVMALTGVPDILKNLSYVTVTCGELNPALIRNLKAAFVLLGIPAEKYSVQDQMNSFFYYTAAQKSEIRTRKMALFHFRGDLVSYRALDTDRVSRPALVRPEDGEESRLPSFGQERDRAFLAFARHCMEGKLFSSVFITGEGFDKTWAQTASIPYLCRSGRHVFAGKNLYVRGACYASRERAEQHLLRDVLYMGPDLVRTHVGMELLKGGSPVFCPLIRAGQNWYEAGESLELIPEKADSLVFSVTSIDGKSRKKVRMELPGLPQRPDRMTRLRVSASMSSRTLCRIKVEDLGFGGFYEASGMVFEDSLEFPEDK